MKRVSEKIAAKRIIDKIAAWLRGLVWTAMILGCAWAGAQSYVVTSPGHYKVIAMGTGAGAGAGAGQGEAAQNAEALSKDDLFAGTEVFAKGASDITEITMDPDTLNLVGGPDERRAHNMVLNVVRTYSYDKPGMYNMSDVDAIRNKLNTGDWHCSVHVRDLKNGSGSDVCNKHRTDGMKETAIIEVSPKSLTFIHTIRKNGSPGSSELGFFPMLPGIGPMTMIAMTNPEALAEMQAGLSEFPMMLSVHPDLMLRLDQLKVRPFHEQQMRHLNEQMKGLKDLKVQPFNEKQLKDLDEQMKNLQVMPVPPTPATPETPETPQVAPAPPTPATPQIAPAPATPATPQVAPAPETPVTPQSASPATAPQPPSI